MPISNPSVAGASFRFGWGVSDVGATGATRRDVFGRHEARLATATVDPVPTTASHLNANFGQILHNITTMNVAGTLRLTGTSWDPSTGTSTPADTEDIVVGATGYFLSVKHWSGTVVLSSVGGLDVVLDSFFEVPFLIGRDYTLDSILAEFVSTGAANTATILLRKFTLAAGFTTVFGQTILNIASATSGKHARDSLAEIVLESTGDWIILEVTTQRLADYHFDIGGF